jgi:hypothetical protein
MTIEIENLLEHAIKTYVKDSVFCNYNIGTVNKNPFTILRTLTKNDLQVENIISHSSTVIWLKGSSGAIKGVNSGVYSIFRHNQWAKVISTPVQEKIPKIKPGEWCINPKYNAFYFKDLKENETPLYFKVSTAKYMHSAPQIASYTFSKVISNLGRDISSLAKITLSQSNPAFEELMVVVSEDYVHDFINSKNKISDESGSLSVSVIPDYMTDPKPVYARDLPYPIKKLWLFRQQEVNNPFNSDKKISCLIRHGGFSWENTPERYHFWYLIDSGNFTVFKNLYGNNGENLPKEINVTHVNTNSEKSNIKKITVFVTKRKNNTPKKKLYKSLELKKIVNLKP